MSDWQFDGRHERPSWPKRPTPWGRVLLLVALAGFGLWATFGRGW